MFQYAMSHAVTLSRLGGLHQWLDAWGTAAFSIVNILLTAAIAAATVQQWKVGQLVYQLQKSVEDDRHSVWFFQRMKPYSFPGFQDIALEISNLTESGAWLEQVRVVVDVAPSEPNRAKAIAVQKIIPSWGTATVHLGVTMREELVKTNTRSGVPVTFYVESQLWAKGKFHLEITNRYTADVGRFDVINLKDA